MNDPLVVALRYSLVSGDDVQYENPPPLTAEAEGFSIRLEDGVLSCQLHDQFGTVAQARKHVESVLRAWEIDAALSGRRGEMSFSYESADLVDRDPPPGQLPALRAEGRGVVTFGADVSLLVRRKQYPGPPSHFVASPDVEVLWSRYEAFLDGREPLLSMAYFCLTVLEIREGSRSGAAGALKIERDLLNKIGELTSTRGDAVAARKMLPESKQQPLIPEEERWLKTAIPALIQHVGQFDAGASPEELTLERLAS